MEPYIGKYFSAQYIRSKVLKQSDTEMLEIDKQIKKEIKDGIIPDPASIDQMTGMPIQDTSGGMDLGQPIMEPGLEKQGKATEVKMPKGGEI